MQEQCPFGQLAEVGFFRAIMVKSETCQLNSIWIEKVKWNGLFLLDRFSKPLRWFVAFLR